MTTKQRTELDAAIERATAAGLEVVAHGYRKAKPSVRIYCVPSQTEANRWHVISLYGSHLVCDCRSRVICAHRAAVHMELVVEAAKQAMHAAEIEAAFERDAQATCAIINDSTTYTPSPALVRAQASLDETNAMLAKMESPTHHFTCPGCGNRNGVFEQLGSGVCNECLDEKAKLDRDAANDRRDADRWELIESGNW